MGLSVLAISNRGLLAGTSIIAVGALFWLASSFGEDAFGALGFAIGAALLLGAGLWLWLKGVEEAIDHLAMRFMDPAQHKPGHWVAVAGQAVPLGETMKAILSDREALACHYQVTEKQRGMRHEGGPRSVFHGMLYEGHHLVPTGIRNDAGTVPLRALPDLVNLEKSGFGHGESRLDQTAERGDKRARSAALAQLAARTQDRFDIDWKYGDAKDNSSIIRKEWVLSPGEQVCVFGRWDGQALTPGPLRPRGLPVYAGTAEQVRARLGGGSKVFFVLGLVPFLIFAWWAYTIIA